MVHRTDSRLLANLLSHEKEYTKQLSTALDYSQASLSSFSAYASATPPPASQVILAVAGSIAGADEALHKYVAAVDGWSQQLKYVKELEGEVANIMRDREIYVTRLLKASKQQKPTRDSFIASPSGSPGGKSEPVSKLNVAQSELQACETQLANKERELDAMRLSAIRVGLHARCKAMVECGWAWGEMGKEGLRALEDLDVPNGHTASNSGYTQPFKALPDPYQAPSDLSSILPSHSASQIALVSPPGTNGMATSSSPSTRPYSLQIPPAHSISELVLPSQHVAENPVDDTSSSIYEEPRPVEVHENERLTNGRSFSMRSSSKPKPKPKTSGDSNPAYFHPKPPLPNGSPSKSKERKTSGMFGSLAGFFHRHDSKGRWQTKNNSSDSDDDSVRYLSVTTTKQPTADDKLSTTGRLKKHNKERSSPVRTNFEHPYAATSPLAQPPIALSASPTMDKGKARASMVDFSDLTPKPARVRGSLTRRASSSNPSLPLNNGGGTLLSRDNSISKASQLSSMSAPPDTNVVFRPGSVAKARLPAAPRKRTTSATVSRQSSVARSSHSRSGSLGAAPVSGTPAQPNLMSIVEEAVRQNQKTRNMLDPNNRLQDIKAPPSASETLNREKDLNMSQIVPPRIPSPAPATVRPNAPGGASVKSADTKIEKRPEAVRKPQSVAVAPEPQLLSPIPHLAVLSDSISPSFINKPLPIKSPLKSALRNGSNSSRSPSPNPATLPLPRSPPIEPVPSPLPTLSTSPTAFKNFADDDDGASINSFVTVHETFEPEPEPEILAPPPPPPHTNGNGNGNSDVSSSTASAGEVTSVPVRRKSVRMSLPPTFSPTPPAVEEWEDDKKYPWAARVPENPRAKNGLKEERDIWDDSSDEDVEYSKARKLLSKVSGKRHH